MSEVRVNVSVSSIRGDGASTEVALVDGSAHVTVDARANGGSAIKRALPELQLWIVLPYVVSVLVFGSLSIWYANSSFRLSMIWLVALLVASQIVIDVAKFSSPEAKGRFSAVYRFLAGASVIATAYFSPA